MAFIWPSPSRRWCAVGASAAAQRRAWTRTPAALPMATSGVQLVPATMVPPVGLSRSAPTVLRVADLRAIIAGRRCLPGDEAAPSPHRSYAPRQQVVNITYTVMQGVAAPPDPPPAGPAAAQALGVQLASTAPGGLARRRPGWRSPTPSVHASRAARGGPARRDGHTEADAQEAEKRHAMAKLITGASPSVPSLECATHRSASWPRWMQRGLLTTSSRVGGVLCGSLAPPTIAATCVVAVHGIP